jgi:hypothetical protein
VPIKDRDLLCVLSNRRLCEVGSVILVCRGPRQFVIDGSDLMHDLFCEFLSYVLICLERLNSIQQSECIDKGFVETDTNISTRIEGIED